MVDARNSLAVNRQVEAASLPVTLAQSCSMLWRMRGRRPRDWMAQALSELRVVRGSTDTPVHLAPLDHGALALPPRGFQPRVCGSQFRDNPASVQKLLPKTAQVEAQRGSALSQGYVDPRVGK